MTAQATDHSAAIQSVLARHLPAVIAQTVWERGLTRARLRASEVSEATLSQLLEGLEKVARLFAPSKVPQIVADLRESHRASLSTPASVSVDIDSEIDVSHARIAARLLCQRLGASSLAAQKLATVTSELARNIVSYTPGGRIEFQPIIGPPRRVVIRASDRGAGIRNLAQIMSGDYRSRTGLGRGLRGSKQLVDRFEIDSGPQGTRIEAELQL